MKKTILFLITIIIFLIAIFGIIFIYQISVKTSFEGEKEFVIEKGQTVNTISAHLYEQDIIKSRFAFESYLYFCGLEKSVQAGTYILTPMNITDLVEIFVAGKVDNEVQLKFIEGWTMQEIANELVKQKVITSPKEFLNLAIKENFQTDYNFLNNFNFNSLEGFLFPDTYSFYKDATINDVIIKMLDNFNDKLTPAMRTEIKAQNKNLYDVLIIASIIEAEVQTDEDRKIVASILWKRLNAEMSLQVDSSLKYVIGKQNRGALTYDELKIDSPYNTYKYKGLPPTPIGNPSISAIRAAIYPKNSDYWFYLSDKQGNTHFSKTLAEHEENVWVYLQ